MNIPACKDFTDINFKWQRLIQKNIHSNIKFRLPIIRIIQYRLSLKKYKIYLCFDLVVLFHCNLPLYSMKYRIQLVPNKHKSIFYLAKLPTHATSLPYPAIYQF